MRITIPTTLKDITLRKYLSFQKLAKQEGNDVNFIKLSAVTIFCGITTEEAFKMTQKDFNETYAIIEKTLQLEPVFTQRFTMNGNEFGFIPNLDKMTAAEYMDLDNYCGNDETWSKAMAVLYRPVVNKLGKMYSIEPYQGSDKYSELMMDATLDVVLGSMVFFYNLNNELLTSTIAYLEQPEQKKELEAALAQSGGGILPLIQSLTEASLSMKRLLKWEYMYSLPT